MIRLSYIFEVAQSERELKYEIGLSYQQIYLDGISDLLAPNNQLSFARIRRRRVREWGQVGDCCNDRRGHCSPEGQSNGPLHTKMNADSSRSHARLIPHQAHRRRSHLTYMLYLVDLAALSA